MEFENRLSHITRSSLILNLKKNISNKFFFTLIDDSHWRYWIFSRTHSTALLLFCYVLLSVSIVKK